LEEKNLGLIELSLPKAMRDFYSRFLFFGEKQKPRIQLIGKDDKIYHETQRIKNGGKLEATL
jgi:hypothetical protein